MTEEGVAQAEALYREARRLGLDHFGIAPVVPPERPFAFQDWLDAGFAGEMAPWMAKNPGVREDPRRRFPWAKSVLVGAMHYAHTLPEDLPEERLAHHVARYARGRDYHKVVKKRLKALCRFIRETLDGEAEVRPYVDTGPFLEGEYFIAANLGWMGKHTLAINRERGSWFVIGIVFTSLELPVPVHVQPDLCGSCTRCLDACPTDAIVEAYRVDARKCISYQTIEQRGPIDEPVAREMGEWVFGCDICQEVCPWNRKASASVHPEFAPSETMINTELQAVLRWDRETFDTRLQGSPLRRPGHEGIRRNITTHLDHRDDPTDDHG